MKKNDNDDANDQSNCVGSKSTWNGSLNRYYYTSQPNNCVYQRMILFCMMIIMIGQMCNIGGDASNGFTLKRRVAGTNGEKSLQEWDDVFQQRTDDDWRLLWHKEKHRRCQHQLLSHMELVCEKDIYKLARRRRRKRDTNDEFDSYNGQFEIEYEQEQNDPENESNDVNGTNGTRSIITPSLRPLFSNFKEANLFGRRQLVRNRKQSNHGKQSNTITMKRSSGIGRTKRGISDECCSGPDGCSWEEYAEYCPANVRVRT
ncbi:hypothetical protein RDWZM_003771 [Blomia tropicalis]|uniref:Insulin-like domain-containing protein n=1 Tax=Blomia tropicalis TaxID=40697 RepID=A0A9Q0MG32_BLOTA|nr:hypothetical protein RDWZM_003771 [Blomia tropicalis]